MKCTSCGWYMVRRKSRHGKHFYGCSYYPRCGNTMEIE
nr:topoisomerase DNA-binding C4 zinc finger domain-containing protein [Pseudoneobacillus rhizosphaerae]